MRVPDYLTEVFSEPEPCPYREGFEARMPLYLPRSPLDWQDVDELLSLGFRRSGVYFYNTQCPLCSECLPTRVQVATFVPSRSQKRALKRSAESGVRVMGGLPQVDDQRVEMFNSHRQQRGLDVRSGEVTADGYNQFLIESCCAVLEISQWIDDQLIAVSIVDVGANSASAVYTYFDPKYSPLSPGTVAILKGIEFCRAENRKWFYLGMYVADNSHLSYKDRFLPQERLIDGHWRPFER